MEGMYGQIDLNSYVAKYVDEMGCSLEEACEQLGIDPSEVFKADEKENY